MRYGLYYAKIKSADSIGSARFLWVIMPGERRIHSLYIQSLSDVFRECRPWSDLKYNNFRCRHDVYTLWWNTGYKHFYSFLSSFQWGIDCNPVKGLQILVCNIVVNIFRKGKIKFSTFWIWSEEIKRYEKW